ncbi:MAG: hypothetical protein AAGA36_05510 [Pseudomonadota bacterium]
MRSAMPYHVAFQPAAQINPAEWDQWLKAQDCMSFQQYFAYGLAVNRSVYAGKDKATYCTITNDQCDGVAQGVLFQSRIGPLLIGFMPAGLCLRPDVAASEIYAALWHAFRRRWRSALIFGAYAQDIADKPVYADGASALWGFTNGGVGPHRQKWRNRLTKAKGAGLRLRKNGANSKEGRWLAAQEDAQRKRLGYKALPLDLPLHMHQASGSAQCFVVVAYDGETPVAGGQFLWAAPYGHYISGVSTALGRRLSAQHLVLQAAAETLHSKGAKGLHLGQIDTDVAPGLARFKLGTGAVPIENPATFVRLG